MTAPKEVIELVERFERNLDDYKSGKYNETQLRREFLDPFFEALGWDVNNKQGYAPAYREVTHEESLSVGEWTKSPDYCFRVGKERKFFLEAKKPSVNIKDDISPAYQLRRYAWSAKLSLSILSDFEEFAVYDCRIKPVKTNGAKVARIMYLTYKDYIEKWDEIAGVFSREAVLKGSFDKYAEKGKKKRGTEEVDDEFLKEIESWRELLAKNIATNNPELSTRELNYSVQSTIDRIIFLRICEDRKIEDYARLMALQNGGNAYQRLCEIFRQADDKYNSGLFHFSEEKERTGHPDTLSLKLVIDDKPIKEIIKGLYYPDSPYQFDYMPIEILGQVYEQFLGKVIHLTENHQALIEEKPEVRKAGGVYYTPKYIVDYIVKNTVGKLLEGKTPKQVEKVKILDPACGSGSFLIGAYQYLLDWHREWYEKDNPLELAKKKSPVIYQDTQGEWQLTIAEKKRILLHNIFGVDIDSQAVEVTKLSLLLKVLEGETSQTINSTLRLFHERALPDLGNNIKCGNSLIGSDFYDNQQVSFLNEEEKYRVNAFDWKTEFQEIIDEGGFDVVIGNPPYNATLTKTEEEYLQNKYEGVKAGRQDTAAIFTEIGLKKAKNSVMYLLPYRLISRKRNHGPFQRWLYSNGYIQQLLYIGTLKEIGANDEFMIMEIKPDEGSKRKKYMSVAPYVSKEQIVTNEIVFDKIEQERWGPPSFDMKIRLGQFNGALLEKIEQKSMPMANIAESRDGIVPFIRDVMISDIKKDDRYKPLLGVRGRYVLDRYHYSWGGTYICYDINEAKKHIKDKNELRKVQLRDEAIFLKPEKIITAQDSAALKGALDSQGYYVTNSIHTTYLIDKKSPYNIRYLLGLINSKMINYFHNSLILKGTDLHPQVLISNLSKLPIRIINFNKIEEKEQHDEIVDLVYNIIEQNNHLVEVSMPQEKVRIQRQIESTDRQIDQLVYKLYGLTEEEIKTVEELCETK